MIRYSPIDSDADQKRIANRPKTCFIITQLGEPVPPQITEIREHLASILKGHGLTDLDAASVVTGRDFLLKIWKLITAVPLGVAIIDENMSPETLCNIFYEIGLMQALGKETVVIKTVKAKVPSDFVRTEYIKFDSQFETNIEKYFHTYWELADHYESMADLIERDPLLAIDYLRRSYLMTGRAELKDRAKNFLEKAGSEERAKNSVEQLLVDF